MKVLICGDRNWKDKDSIRSCLIAHVGSVGCIELLIEGGARGADRLGAEVAAELGIPVKEVPAEWDRYGKAAGPIRNTKMLEEQPDLVLAFHDDLPNSKGTKNMVEQAQTKGIRVVICFSKSMRTALDPTTPEVIKNCPRCGATESMLKATVRLNVNPLLTSKGFLCGGCNLFIEVAGWADDIEKANISLSWD